MQAEYIECTHLMSSLRKMELKTVEYRWLPPNSKLSCLELISMMCEQLQAVVLNAINS